MSESDDSKSPSPSNLSDTSGEDAPLRTRKCPKCAKRFTFRTVASWKPYPFCSERCRLIDLGAWLSEEYQIVEPAMDPDALAEMSDEELEQALRNTLPEDMRPQQFEDDEL